VPVLEALDPPVVVVGPPDVVVGPPDVVVAGDPVVVVSPPVPPPPLPLPPLPLEVALVVSPLELLVLEPQPAPEDAKIPAAPTMPRPTFHHDEAIISSLLWIQADAHAERPERSLLSPAARGCRRSRRDAALSTCSHAGGVAALRSP